jgi:hypothetical protein
LKQARRPILPFKRNACRRHHIGKMKFMVTNRAEYEAGLRRRGSLTLWHTPEALSFWQAPKRTTRGGQPRYSDPADGDCHIAAINTHGRMKRPVATGYGTRSLVETAIDLCKSVIGRRLRALIRGTADRGCHRHRRPQSNAGLHTPEIRSIQQGRRVVRPSKTEDLPFNDS